MRFGYRVHYNGDHKTFSVFDSKGEYNTNLYVADDENFELVTALIEEGDEEKIIEAVKNSRDYFAEQRRLFRGAVTGDDFLFEDAIAKKFSVYLDKDRPDEVKAALGKFFARLSRNPNGHSQDNLFSWLSTQGNDFRITNDGLVVGYRGLTSGFKSRHAGFAIVNGTPSSNGPVDNAVGNVVEMPRHMVNHDPSHGCSFGLHVGTESYAKGWAGPDGKVVVVLVDPADVVSVPTDCAFQKMRVCKYRVAAEITGFEYEVYTIDDMDDEDDDYYDEEED